MPGHATNQMAIRDALVPDACLTIDALDEALPSIHRREIVKAVGVLINRGYAERVALGCYQLTEAGRKSAKLDEVMKSGPHGADTANARKPQQNSLRQRAWNAMRIPGSFSIPDLIIAADTGSKDAETNLQRYLKGLAAVGYVIELPIRQRGTRPGSNGFKLFRLLNDTGETAPVYRLKKGEVYDHNTQEIHKITVAEELS